MSRSTFGRTRESGSPADLAGLTRRAGAGPSHRAAAAVPGGPARPGRAAAAAPMPGSQGLIVLPVRQPASDRRPELQPVTVSDFKPVLTVTVPVTVSATQDTEAVGPARGPWPRLHLRYNHPGRMTRISEVPLGH